MSLTLDGSNGIILPVGNLTSPSLGSAGAGMYVPAANTLAFVTNSLNRITIDSSGTVSLANNVVVSGTLTFGGTTISANTNLVTLTDSQTLTNKTLTSPTINGGSALDLAQLTVDGNTTLGDASGDTLTINGTAISAPNGLNVNSNQLVLNGGNFGVGTASPTSKFDVGGTIRSTSQTAPSSGSGVELIGGATANYLIAYNRTTPGFLPLIVQGSTLGLYNGSSQGLLVDASGNIAINHTSAASKLDVTGTSNTPLAGLAIRSYSANRTQYTSLDFAGLNVVNTGSPGQSLQLAVEGSTKVWVTGAGNVGIGTNSPILGKLNVTTGFAATDTTARPVAFFSSTDAAVPGSSPSGLYVQYTGNATATNRLVELFSTTLGSGSYGAMRLNNSISILSSGNVGIGTSSPASKLHVFGELPAGGAYFESSSTANPAPVVRVRGNRIDANGSQAFSGGLVLERFSSGGTISSSSALGTIYFGGNYSGSSFGYTASISAVASANWSSTTTANTDLVFLTGSTAQTALGTPNVAYGTECMRIASSGNVGIGTSSPSRKLTVYGSDNVPFFNVNGYDVLRWTSATLDIGGITSAQWNTVRLFTSGTERVAIDSSGQCIWKPNGVTSAMTLDASGNLLVGDTGTILNSRFYVKGVNDSASDLNFIFVNSTGNTMLAAFNDGALYANAIKSGAGTNAVRFNTSTGQITYDTSSARYKDNIRDSSYGLQHVLLMRSAQFEYKDDERSDIGFIAEEMEKVIPELVGKDKNNEPDSVSYDRMVSVCVKAIQELHAEIETLKQRIH